MYDRIDSHIQNGITLRETLKSNQISTTLIDVANIISSCTGTILTCGNGGSASDAQHLSAELMVRFKAQRKPLPVICLNSNDSILTAIGNDYDFFQIFSRQVEAFDRRNNVLIAFSTSGKSANIIRALESANNLTTVGFTGNNPTMAELCDYCFTIPSNETSLIQEMHITLVHILCDLIEYQLLRG